MGGACHQVGRHSASLRFLVTSRSHRPRNRANPANAPPPFNPTDFGVLSGSMADAAVRGLKPVVAETLQLILAAGTMGR